MGKIDGAAAREGKGVVGASRLGPESEHARRWVKACSEGKLGTELCREMVAQGFDPLCLLAEGSYHGEGDLFVLGLRHECSALRLALGGLGFAKGEIAESLGVMLGAIAGRDLGDARALEEGDGTAAELLLGSWIGGRGGWDRAEASDVEAASEALAAAGSPKPSGAQARDLVVRAMYGCSWAKLGDLSRMLPDVGGAWWLMRAANAWDAQGGMVPQDLAKAWSDVSPEDSGLAANAWAKMGDRLLSPMPGRAIDARAAFASAGGRALEALANGRGLERAAPETREAAMAQACAALLARQSADVDAEAQGAGAPPRARLRV